MIREVNTPPLVFEHIVTEGLTAPLAAYGFQFEEPFHLYKNELVPFMRERQSVRESIEFGRCIYDAEEMAASTKEDEVNEPYESGQGKLWRSRHFLYVQLITRYIISYPGCDSYTTHKSSDLLPNGKAGWSPTGDNWFYFADEEDLRRRLQEILPLILTVGLQSFNDHLEDIAAEQLTTTAV